MAMTQTVPYELLGGEAGVRALCKAFYRIMDESEEARDIRRMHKKDLAPMEQKLFEYLSAWLGGPPLYVQRTGRMCITDPHRPYRIGKAERDQWLKCMNQALDEIGASDEVKDMLRTPLFRVADMLRNVEEDEEEARGERADVN